MKNPNDNIGYGTRDIPACSTMPQPIALPRAPCQRCSNIFFNCGIYPFSIMAIEFDGKFIVYADGRTET